MRVCKVTFQGSQGVICTREVKAESLFEAVDAVIRYWATRWEYKIDAVMKAESGSDVWYVEQDRVRVWRKARKGY